MSKTQTHENNEHGHLYHRFQSYVVDMATYFIGNFFNWHTKVMDVVTYPILVVTYPILVVDTVT